MSDADCRVAKLRAGAVPRPWLLRNRMSELFTYGSVGGVGYNLSGNARGRPAPTRKGTLTPYQPSEVAVMIVVTRDVKRFLKGAPDPYRSAP